MLPAGRPDPRSDGRAHVGADAPHPRRGVAASSTGSSSIRRPSACSRTPTCSRRWSTRPCSSSAPARRRMTDSARRSKSIGRDKIIGVVLNRVDRPGCSASMPTQYYDAYRYSGISTAKNLPADAGSDRERPLPSGCTLRRRLARSWLFESVPDRRRAVVAWRRACVSAWRRSRVGRHRTATAAQGAARRRASARSAFYFGDLYNLARRLGPPRAVRPHRAGAGRRVAHPGRHLLLVPGADDRPRRLRHRRACWSSCWSSAGAWLFEWLARARRPARTAADRRHQRRRASTLARELYERRQELGVEIVGFIDRRSGAGRQRRAATRA